MRYLDRIPEDDVIEAMFTGDIEAPRHFALHLSWLQRGFAALALVLPSAVRDQANARLLDRYSIRDLVRRAHAAYATFEHERHAALCEELAGQIEAAVTEVRGAVAKDAAAALERFRANPPTTKTQRIMLEVMAFVVEGRWDEALARVRLAGAN